MPVPTLGRVGGGTLRMSASNHQRRYFLRWTWLLFPFNEVPTFSSISSPQLNDQSLPLFDRYQAMFSLRNNGSKAAALALTTAFADPSPLFRHEAAYVLGQLQVRRRVLLRQACISGGTRA